MNLRPTKGKIIGVIIALILDFLFWFVAVQLVDCTGKGICIGKDIETVFYLTVRHPFSWLFLILVYVIWSLVQKKYNKKVSRK